VLGDGQVHTKPGQFGSIKTSARTDDKSSGKAPYRRGLPKELYRKSFADKNTSDKV